MGGPWSRSFAGPCVSHGSREETTPEPSAQRLSVLGPCCVLSAVEAGLCPGIHSAVLRPWGVGTGTPRHREGQEPAQLAPAVLQNMGTAQLQRVAAADEAAGNGRTEGRYQLGEEDQRPGQRPECSPLVSAVHWLPGRFCEGEQSPMGRSVQCMTLLRGQLLCPGLSRPALALSEA